MLDHYESKQLSLWADDGGPVPDDGFDETEDEAPEILCELLNEPRPSQSNLSAVVVFPGGKIEPLSCWHVFVTAALAWRSITLKASRFT